MNTTWRKELTKTFAETGDTWDDVEACTLTDAELDVSFDDGYGVMKGAPFTLWTARHVYFPIVYDGSEWVGSVSRHPNGEPTPHQGGH